MDIGLRAFIAFLLAVLGSSTAFAQIPCSRGAVERDVSEAAAIRSRILAIKIDEDAPPSDFPQPLQRDLPLFKAALARVARDVVACHDTSATPQSLEAEIARLLHANPPQPSPGQTVASNDPRYTEWESFSFGHNLQVRVKNTRTPLLTIEFSFHIECGDDEFLLVFEPDNQHWRERLLWQSPAYHDTSGAFGDIFQYASLKSTAGRPWRIIAVHGHPWCTSRHSGFEMELLEPTADPAHPRVLWRTTRGYSRGDFAAHLTAGEDTFEFRVHADEMEFNDVGFERLVIYRYRVQGNTVTRLQPIAANARGFVEEWLSMPWTEAANQSAPGPDVDALHRIHTFYGQSPAAESDNYTSWAAGPVRACSTPEHFQVAFDSETKHIVPGKPGGTTDNLHHHYFQLQHIPTGYRLLSISPSPDSTCTGPDLMREHSH